MATADAPNDAPNTALLTAPWRKAPSSRRLLDALEEQGRRARFVGGCVRDTLAGRARAAWDLDLCTQEPPERVLRLLAAAGIEAIPTGLKHGTVTAVIGAQPFEITTLRRDAATDGRHAVVVFTDDFREDAARRDFTVNAMSCDREGRLFDYFAGRDDLAAGRLRFVGAPERRIEEDYLRVLRFFRFYASFGRRPPDNATAAALRAGVAGLDRLSGERVRQETRRLLEAPDPRAAVALMAELGILAWLLGAGPRRRLFESLVAHEREADWLLRLAALVRSSGTAADELAQRLRLSNAEAERLQRLADATALDPRLLDDAELRRRLVLDGPDVTLAEGLWFLAENDAAASAFGAWRERVAATPVPALPLAGRDVLALGVPPGPEVGRLLGEVEARWRAGGCVADREQVLAWLREAVARG